MRLGRSGPVEAEAPYFCPMCKGNRDRFTLIFKIAREIEKDPKTGVVRYVADEFRLMSPPGPEELEVRCLACGYTAGERTFQRAARNDPA